MLKCVVWRKPQDNTYYHKIIKGHYEYFDYTIGNKNSYGHEIVHIIEHLELTTQKTPMKKRVVRKAIKFLQKYD